MTDFYITVISIAALFTLVVLIAIITHDDNNHTGGLSG